MPSGKKKRKAIRKKKALEAHLVNGSHVDKIENLRSQIEQGGDDGDVGLPASHGRRQAVNGERKEPAEDDTLPVGTTADANNSVEVPMLKEEESSYGNRDVETLTGPMSNDCVGIGSLKEILPESANKVSGLQITQAESAIQIADSLPQEVTEVTDSTRLLVQNSKDTNDSEGTNLIVPRASAAVGTAQVKSTTVSSNMISEHEGTLGNVASQASGFDFGSTKFGAKVYPVSTDFPAPDTKKQEPKFLQSSVPVNCDANGGLKRTEDTHATEYSEKQPLVAPVPRVTERTSWMDCCGILDLFSGSSR